MEQRNCLSQSSCWEPAAVQEHTARERLKYKKKVTVSSETSFLKAINPLKPTMHATLWPSQSRQGWHRAVGLHRSQPFSSPRLYLGAPTTPHHTPAEALSCQASQEAARGGCEASTLGDVQLRQTRPWAAGCSGPCFEGGWATWLPVVPPHLNLPVMIL